MLTRGWLLDIDAVRSDVTGKESPGLHKVLTATSPENRARVTLILYDVCVTMVLVKIIHWLSIFTHKRAISTKNIELKHLERATIGQIR